MIAAMGISFGTRLRANLSSGKKNNVDAPRDIVERPDFCLAGKTDRTVLLKPDHLFRHFIQPGNAAGDLKSAGGNRQVKTWKPAGKVARPGKLVGLPPTSAPRTFPPVCRICLTMLSGRTRLLVSS
jgi:hypothetical protein